MNPTPEEKCKDCDGNGWYCEGPEEQPEQVQCRNCNATGYIASPSPEARVDWEKSCGVCGGKMVLIRGRYPHTDKRSVCPTCLCERMEQIREVADDNYGKAYTTAAFEKGREAR